MHQHLEGEEYTLQLRNVHRSSERFEWLDALGVGHADSFRAGLTRLRYDDEPP